MEEVRNTPIRVYSPGLRFLGAVENHTSLIWTRRYYEPGDFELHAPVTPKNMKLLRPGNIIAKRGDNEAAVIEDREDEESDIKNEVTRGGRFLSSYLDYRLCGKSTINFSGRVEMAMHQLIACADPIPLLHLGAINGFNEQVEFQVTMKNLCTYITKLAKSSALGYRVRPDFKNKKLIFEAYKGIDRTLSQGVNNRVIFSEAYENLNNAIYKYNNQSLRTKAYIGGEGKGAKRIYEIIGGGTGLALREVFIDAKHISSEGLTEAQYRAVLRQYGYEKMAEMIVAESMEAETEAEINFTYRKDYDLGDIATVDKRSWGVKMNKRITELQEIHQFGSMFVVPTFGEPLPEKIDWSA